MQRRPLQCVPGALASTDRRVDLEWSRRRNQLSVVFDGFHQPDQSIGAWFPHKELGERRGFKEVEAHPFPLSSSIATPTGSPCTSTG